MNETINNITIGEYFALKDSSEYDIFIDIMNPKNLLCGNVCNFKAITFDEMEVIKGILRNPNLADIKELFCELYNIKGSYTQSQDNQFFSESVFNLFSAKKYLTNFIEQITERESKHLGGAPDEKWLMVRGGERLGAVSHILTKMRLAEKFSTTPKIIGGWKYSEIFSILVAEKRQADVMKDYNSIK